MNSLAPIRFAVTLAMLILPLVSPGAANAHEPRSAKDAAAVTSGRSPQRSSLPAAGIKAPAGFKVDLLYTVPKATQGSWVNMAVDPKGRLIVSDQVGSLYRVMLPAIGGKTEDIRVETIDVPIGEAHGLLWAFDSLYVVVNRGRKYASGLYRVRDTNGDDTLDKVELLKAPRRCRRARPARDRLGARRQSLYVVAGNATRLTKLDRSLVPLVWGEDNLLPRMTDPQFMTGEKAPGGCIYRVSPDGSRWELVSMGFRNPFDLAFNRDGELFTYDSDMEWDIGAPGTGPPASCTSPAVPNSAIATAPASGRRTTSTACRRWSTSAQARQPASHSATARNSRPSTGTHSSFATGATASSTPCT